MKTKLSCIALVSVLACGISTAQTNEPVVEDFKPSSLNQPGKQYPQVNSERRVRVRVVAPQAQSVVLDFLGGAKYPLAKGEDGAWTGVTRPMDEGFHYYQLVMDGAGVPDPGSQYFYGGGRWGSGLEVPAHDQDFYALKNVPHGQVREVYFFSKSANTNLRCFVYTPPDYDKDPTKRYPVLYLQHGGGEDETGWGRQGQAAFIMDNLIAAGKIRPFIIVMANSYVPGAAGPGRGAAAGGRPGGGAAGPGGRGFFNFSAFERVLIEDLIPHIDETFRTLPDQPHRAMAGLSMGGMQTRTITLAHLDKFSHIGIFSGGSIGLSDIPDLAAFKQKVKLVFVSYGSREKTSLAQRNVEALQQAGIRCIYYEAPNTGHEWQTWRRSLYQFAPLLFEDLPLPQPVVQPPAAPKGAADTPAPAPGNASTDISGIWKSEFDSLIGRQQYTFTFKQDGPKLTGKASSVVGDRQRETELLEGKVHGRTISFVEVLNFQGNDIRISYTGQLSADGNEIQFTRTVGDFARTEIVAKREAAAPDAAVAPAPANPVPLAPPASAEAPAGPVPLLIIDAAKVTGKVSPMFYGLMTEEINFSYEGGIYAELIRNRSFKADAILPRVTPETYEVGKYLPASFRPDTKPRYWTAVGGASLVLDTNNPLNEFLNVSLKLDASTASATSPAGVANGGYWGIPVKPNTTYTVSFFGKASPEFGGPVTVSIESADGRTTFASADIHGLTTEWKRFETKLQTPAVPPSKDNVFKLTTRVPGTLWLQNVSLFPPTYKNRKNGNRIDLMELLAALKPKFLRFPGGNYLEGNAFNQRFNWKETIGPVERRPGHPSPWGYWSTAGLGLLEFAQWCEDLDMEPVLGVFAGYCLGRGGVVPAGPKLEPFVQEALEEIEYLIGDPQTTVWGARRAADGHPEPFKLTYVEIGNEDWFDRTGSYDARFAQFYDAIKKKYPHLKVISSIGYEQPQHVWVKSRIPDLVDEHFYRNMEEMMAQAFRYDTYARTNPTKIFCGEWATRVGSPTPNLAGALGDAAWMTCLERNADIVLMHCYAPLLVNVSQLEGPGRSMQWSSDLIGYDALSSYGSPSYYAHVMFSSMHGDEILATDAQDIPTRPWERRSSRGGPAPVQQIRQIFFSATRDSRSGIIYVKVVNTTGSPRHIKLRINGAPNIKSDGEAVTLAGTSLDDTNSIEQPRKIVPHTTQISSLGPEFTRQFPAYSITVLKLQTL